MQKEFIGSALLHGGLIIVGLIWMGLPAQNDAPSEGSVVVDIISNSLVTTNLSEVIESDASQDLVLSGSEVSIAALDDAAVLEPVQSEPLPLEEAAEPVAATNIAETVVSEPIEPLSAPVEASAETLILGALDAESVEVASLAPALPSVDAPQTPDAVAQVMPTPRPPDLEAIRAAVSPPPPVRQTPRPVPQQAGNEGNSNQDSAAAQSSGGQGGAGTGGNADIARYPGQVERKVSRSLRYPKGANGARGEVHVSFTLDASGNLIRVAVARSSGHEVLDQAALATVQRAAPFPAFPQGTPRNQWDFSIPLAFSR